MLKVNWLTVVVSAVLSIVTSLVMHRQFDRQVNPLATDVMRVKTLEIVDTKGGVRATLETVNAGNYEWPRLTMRDADGRESVSLFVDRVGFGTLGFSNNHWPVGAVQVGYLGTREDITLGDEEDARAARDRGAWGIAVRSPRSDYTALGFAAMTCCLLLS